jgi:2-iminobutanoate/2-iminopropanoate deaminase
VFGFIFLPKANLSRLIGVILSMPRKVIELYKPWTQTVSFSLGVVGEGRILFTSGITARNSDGEVIGKGDMRAQMEMCFQNVGDVLRAAGTDFNHVLKWTMYTTDIDEFSKNSDVYKRHFINRPASTLVEVRRLIFPEMLVEIEAVALLP